MEGPSTPELKRYFEFSHLPYNRFNSVVLGLPIFQIFLDYKLLILHSPCPLVEAHEMSKSVNLPHAWGSKETTESLRGRASDLRLFQT